MAESAKAVAKGLARAFMGAGRFSLAGDRAAAPAATPDDGEQLPDLGSFAGLQVHSVGYDPGSEDEDGKVRPQSVLIYVVRGSQKMLRSLPKEVNGVSVRSVLMGAMNVKPQASVKQAPLVYLNKNRIACGSSCAPTGVTYSGTLGALLTDGSDIFCLSNNHVLGDCNHMLKGMPILAPSSKDAGPSMAPRHIASFEKLIALPSGHPTHVKPAKLDVAVARVRKDQISSWQGDTTDGYETPVTTATPFTGMVVKKFGRTTGLTHGIVESHVDQPFAIPYVSEFFRATVWFNDTWTVRARGQHFGLPGDSGSLVVSDDGETAIGLLFAANPAGTYGWILPIEAVLKELKMKLTIT